MLKNKVIIFIATLSFIYAGLLLSIIVYAIYYFPLNIQIAPIQPVEFSHKIHAGRVELDCQYCHIYARRSSVAGLPSVKTCINCHAEILRDSPEIRKVAAYWENKSPIPWIRVYDLPDFVYFSHKRHLAKGISCAICHGNVKDMDRIKKIRSLRMGWCINCHKENQADIECITCHK